MKGAEIKNYSWYKKSNRCTLISYVMTNYTSDRRKPLKGMAKMCPKNKLAL